MQVTVAEPIGATIADVDLGSADDDTVEELRRLLADQGVLVAPDQTLVNEAFTAFQQRFGDLTLAKGETPVGGHPDLDVISDTGRTITRIATPGRAWSR